MNNVPVTTIATYDGTCSWRARLRATSRSIYLSHFRVLLSPRFLHKKWVGHIFCGYGYCDCIAVCIKSTTMASFS